MTRPARTIAVGSLVGILFLVAGAVSAAPTKTAKKAKPAATGPRKATHEEKQAFREAIRLETKTAQACYHADVARSKRPNLRGLVSIRFVVNFEGRVTEAGPIHNTTRSRYLADCLIRMVEKIRFAPGAAGGTIGTHAFRFPL